MEKTRRRQMQNGQYMRDILCRLKEYDLAEVRMICERYRQLHPPEKSGKKKRES